MKNIESLYNDYNSNNFLRNRENVILFAIINIKLEEWNSYWLLFRFCTSRQQTLRYMTFQWVYKRDKLFFCMCSSIPLLRATFKVILYPSTVLHGRIRTHDLSDVNLLP